MSSYPCCLQGMPLTTGPARTTTQCGAHSKFTLRCEQMRLSLRSCIAVRGVQASEHLYRYVGSIIGILHFVQSRHFNPFRYIFSCKYWIFPHLKKEVVSLCHLALCCHGPNPSWVENESVASKAFFLIKTDVGPFLLRFGRLGGRSVCQIISGISFHPVF